MFSGLEVGSLFEHQKVFEVLVWSTPNARESITDVRELLVDAPTGGRVRLGDVAKVRVVPTPSVIEREGISRTLNILANVRGRDVNSTAATSSAASRAWNLQANTTGDADGDVGVARSPAGVLFASLAALIGIFFLLQACFRNWSLALACS